jgi:hypothetical protein
MQYLVAAAASIVAVEPIADQIEALDPAALVDVDRVGRLRISTVLPDAEVLVALSRAGLHVLPFELERQPSECCGGCGG